MVSAPGINVNKVIGGGQTALYVACYRGHTEAVRQLVMAPGIDCNRAESGIGETPLHAACGQGHAVVVRVLVNTSGVNINQAERSYGATPLDLACATNHHTCADIVRAAGGTGRGRGAGPLRR